MMNEDRLGAAMPSHDAEHKTALRFKNMTFFLTDESVEFLTWWCDSGLQSASIDDMLRAKGSGC